MTNQCNGLSEAMYMAKRFCSIKWADRAKPYPAVCCLWQIVIWPCFKKLMVSRSTRFFERSLFFFFFFSSLFGLGRIYSRGNCKITQYCGRLLALNKPSHLFGFTWLSISATHLSQFYEKLLASVCKLIMQKSFKCKKACQWGQVTHNCLGAEAVDDKH